MSFRCLLVLLFAIGACGDDGPSSADKLQGLWIFEYEDVNCASTLEIDDNKAEINDLCILNSGQPAVQVQRGTFVLDGNESKWTVTHSSCPGDRRHTETMRYTFLSGDRLRLTRDSGVVVYERPEDDGDGSFTGTVMYGCFDKDLAFTPSSVRRL